MAEAMLNGTTYERTKSTWAKDAEDNRVRVQQPVRMRAWWEVAGHAVLFGLRYGAVTLQLQPGKSAVAVAKLAELPAVIKLLITAAEAGGHNTSNTRIENGGFGLGQKCLSFVHGHPREEPAITFRLLAAGTTLSQPQQRERPKAGGRLPYGASS